MRRDINNFDLEDSEQEEEGGGGFLGLALFALALGAGAAMLYAPAEGSRTRRLVGERIND